MKKNILISTAFLFSLLIANAQTSFQRSYGTVENEVGYCLKQTKDKGYIMSTISSRSCIIKTDSFGNKMWSVEMNVSEILEIEPTQDGGYIASINSIIGQERRSFLMKLNGSGNIEWQRKYNKNLIDFTCIRENKDGTGYLVWGADSAQPVLFHIGYDGSLKWISGKKYMSSNHPNYSNTFVQLASDSCIYALTTSNFLKTPLVLEKFKKDGTPVWSKGIARSISFYNFVYAYVANIEQTFDGHLMVGYLQGKGQNFIELDTTGTIIDNFNYTYPDGKVAVWTLANREHDKSIVMACYTPSKEFNDIILSKTDAAHTILWTKKLGGTNYDQADKILVDNKGAIAMVGTTYSFSQGRGDIYLLKSDVNSSFGCNEKPCPSPVLSVSKDTSTSILFTPKVYMINDSIATNLVTFPGNDTIFDACGCAAPPTASFSIDKLSTINYSVWGKSFFWDFGNGMTDTTFAPLLPYKKNGTYKVCLTASNACGSDSVCKMVTFTSGNNGIDKLSKLKGVTIYPNPFSSYTTIEFDDEQIKTQLKLIDLLGKEIKTTSFSGKQFILDKGEINTGVYFIQLIDQHGNFAQKKIVIN